ncbi:biogenesis of lysosome-related organelles complex 1 subunit 1 [Carica papaya]|uniref:biogenesis of lysosome-related organelles complex 1 subunit 1 n=1 Tax=Carica papaya TaxID=3649 RepID=UPI000B8CF2EF|nr:biogenesis of lysosome-related organelles complex 1 subunit 1 [Carica papaya]
MGQLITVDFFRLWAHRLLTWQNLPTPHRVPRHYIQKRKSRCNDARTKLNFKRQKNRHRRDTNTRRTDCIHRRGCVLPEMEKSKSEPRDLDSSLLKLLQDHQKNSLRLRENTEKAKKDAIRNAVRVSDLLVDAVNGGVQECFLNEKRIEMEIRALTSTITRFMRQTDQWLAASHAINTAIKVIFLMNRVLHSRYTYISIMS